MSQIEELQSRITAAMDRIGQGLDGLSALAVAPDTTETEALQQTLEEEKQANAQLQERVRSLKRRLDDDQADLADKIAAQSNASTKIDADLARLRKANEQLLASNQALRAANQEGVGEPHLINKAMLAELESLRSMRAADSAEASAILGTLGPLIKAAIQGNEETV